LLCVYDSCPSSYPVSYALWSNAELGTEAWYPSGFAARVFAGWAHGWYTSSSACEFAPMDFPYFGVGVGYAF
jgi:hypothetical protein